MINTVWILWVLVFADGEWRAWEANYFSQAACEEVKHLITYRRETVLMAVCVPLSQREPAQ
jgi:hypothetical protein